MHMLRLSGLNFINVWHVLLLGAILFLKFPVMILNSLKKFPIGGCTGNISCKIVLL